MVSRVLGLGPFRIQWFRVLDLGLRFGLLLL